MLSINDVIVILCVRKIISIWRIKFVASIVGKSIILYLTYESHSMKGVIKINVFVYGFLFLKCINVIVHNKIKPTFISGLHWQQEIINMLMKKTSQITDGETSIGFLDMMSIEHFSSLPSPRLLVTHVPYR